MIIGILALILAWPILAGLALTALVLILLATEHEFISSFVVVAAVALVLYALSETGAPIAWQTIATWVGGYVAAGLVFTVPKWYLWAQKMGRKFGVIKVDYDANPSNYGNYGNDVKKFEDVWNTRFSKGVMKVTPVDGKWDVFYDKPTLVGYLTSWILNWPFYAVLLVIEDFVVELVNWFADHVGQTFRRIATKAFNANVTTA